MDKKLTDKDLEFYKKNIKYYFTGVILTFLIMLILIYFRKNDTIADNYQSIFLRKLKFLYIYNIYYTIWTENK